VREITSVDEMKKAVSTTVPLHDWAMFLTLCQKIYGAKRGSTQEGLIEAIRDWNAKKLQTIPAEKRDSFFEQVRDVLRGLVKDAKRKESEKV